MAVVCVRRGTGRADGGEGILLDVAWVPTEQNVEADAITNGVAHWLDPPKQVGTDLATPLFKILHELLAKGGEFYLSEDLGNIDEGDYGEADHISEDQGPVGLLVQLEMGV